MIIASSSSARCGRPSSGALRATISSHCAKSLSGASGKAMQGRPAGRPGCCCGQECPHDRDNEQQAVATDGVQRLSQHQHGQRGHHHVLPFTPRRHRRRQTVTKRMQRPVGIFLGGPIADQWPGRARGGHGIDGGKLRADIGAQIAGGALPEREQPHHHEHGDQQRRSGPAPRSRRIRHRCRRSMPRGRARPTELANARSCRDGHGFLSAHGARR